jgi:hypothetical protein
MKIVPGILVPTNEWVSLHELLTELTPGSAFQVQNDSVSAVLSFRTDPTKPSNDDKAGWPVGIKNSLTAIQIFPSGMNTIWVRGIAETNNAHSKVKANFFISSGSGGGLENFIRTTLLNGLSYA